MKRFIIFVLSLFIFLFSFSSVAYAADAELDLSKYDNNSDITRGFNQPTFHYRYGSGKEQIDLFLVVPASQLQDVTIGEQMISFFLPINVYWEVEKNGDSVDNKQILYSDFQVIYTDISKLNYGGKEIGSHTYQLVDYYIPDNQYKTLNGQYVITDVDLSTIESRLKSIDETLLHIKDKPIQVNINSDKGIQPTTFVVILGGAFVLVIMIMNKGRCR